MNHRDSLNYSNTGLFYLVVHYYIPVYYYSYCSTTNFFFLGTYIGVIFEVITRCVDPE